MEAWLGYGWLDAIHPDDRAYAERQWREAIAARRLVNAEFRLRAPDGGWRWTNVRAAPVLDAGGAIEKWVGLNIDIDARKRAEAALRTSVAKYRSLFGSMDEAYAVVEVLKDSTGHWVDFRFLDANPAFMKHTSMPYPVGRTATELLGSPNPRWTEHYGRVLDTGEPIRIEETEHTLGRTFDLNIFALDRARDQVAVLFTDITTRKRAEAALRESEGRQRALIEGVPQLVWRAVDGGHWTWASPQWTQFTGQSDADSRGHGWLDTYHPDDREAAMDIWRAAVTIGRLEIDARIFHAPDGRYRWFQTRATAVRDEAGRIAEWFGTSTDVDDLRAYQERQQVMVAELQHRTRNLLGVVRSISGQTMRNSRTLQDFEAAFNHRLGALSRVQGLLSRADEEPITIGTLLRSELDALGADEVSERITTRGPQVQLRKGTVQTFALALHELATNALKYGALADGKGRLAVTWWAYTDDTGRRLGLEWREIDLDRSREEESPTTRPGGYGRELIEQALPYVLKARTTYDLGETELICTIDLPLAERGEPKER